MNTFLLSCESWAGSGEGRKEFRAVDGAIVTHGQVCLSASSHTNMQSLRATHGDLMMISKGKKKENHFFGLLFYAAISFHILPSPIAAVNAW